MSFEPKTRREIEMDNLNIKSHLNTSLEAEGISVSEDLIGRTMDAIRLQEVDQDKNKIETKKPIFFRHTRTLITVAAAALILVVGFNALRTLSPIGMKSDMSKSDNSTTNYDAGTTEMYSANENAPKDGYVAYDQDRAKSDTKFTEDMAEDLEEDSKQNTDMFMETKSDEAAGGADEPGLNDIMTGYSYEFTDIILIEAVDVSEVFIASETTGEMNTISDKLQIDDFYTVMEKYSFAPGSATDKDMQYVVIIKSEERESQINIGETTIIVDHSYKDIMSQSIYKTADHSKLLEELKELIGN